MTTPIDTAFVEIKPSFGGFDAQLTRGVDDALRKVDASISRSMREISAEVSAAGGRIAASTAAPFAAIGAQAAATGARLEETFAVATAEVGSEFTALSGVARTEMNHIDSNAAQTSRNIVDSHFGPAIAKIKSLLLGLSIGVGAALVGVAGFGLKSAAALEQTQIQFQSLTGDVARGNQVMADLQKFAALTPFEFPDVARGAARFLAFDDAIGMTDDQLQSFLTTIGNVISATGGGAQAINSVTLAMGQIASSGKLTLDNLNQISEAMPGFSGVAAIAAARGETTAQVMQEITSGTINAKDGITALLQGMAKFPGAAGAMEKQGQTLAGVFSTFKDTISQSLAAGFAPAIPALKQQLAQITPVLGQAIGQLAPVLGSTFTTLIATIAPLVQMLVPIVTPIVDALGQFMKTLSNSGSLAAFGKALGGILKALMPLVPPLAELADTVLQALTPILVALTPAIVALVPPLVDLLEPLTPITEALGAMSAAFAPLTDWLVRALTAFLDWAVIKPFALAIEGVALAVTLAATAVKDFLGWLGKLDWGGIAKAIGGAFADAWKAVTGFFAGVGHWFASLPGVIGDAIHGMVTAAGQKVGELIGWFKSLPGKLVNALGDLGHILWDAGKKIIGGLWDGIKSGFGKIKDGLVWLKDKLTDWKGPPAEDARLLEPAGHLVIGGFQRGIEDTIPAVRALLTDFSTSLPGQVVPTNTSTNTTTTLAPPTMVIQLHFHGQQPTPDQAATLGRAAGNAVADQYTARNIATTVRTM